MTGRKHSDTSWETWIETQIRVGLGHEVHVAVCVGFASPNIAGK